MNTPNITHLSFWSSLAAEGWRPVRYRHAALGVKTGTGAALSCRASVGGQYITTECATVETPTWERVYNSAKDTTKLVAKWPVFVTHGPLSGVHYIEGRKLGRFLASVTDSLK